MLRAIDQQVPYQGVGYQQTPYEQVPYEKTSTAKISAVQGGTAPLGLGLKPIHNLRVAMGGDIPEIDDRLLAEMARTCACFNFRKASRSVTQLFDQILAPTGLRSTQLVILITSQLVGPSSIARLARELVMDRSTLTRNLKPLLSMNLLQMSKAGGGKHKSVELTDDGRAALVKGLPYWDHAQQHLVSRFGPEQWNRIMGELSGVVEATRSTAV